MSNKPRGIRNNNPGNLRYNGTEWLGLATPPSDGAFCVFTAPKYGIRALARVLKIYQSKYGICTIAGIVGRFAPSTENDTGAYIKSMCHQTGYGAHSELDLHNNAVLAELIKAIIRHENGENPYTDTQISEGLKC